MKKLTMLLYRCVYFSALVILKAAGLFSKPIAEVWKQRRQSWMPYLNQDQAQEDHTRILFMVSSAGEYEQALPIAERLESEAKYQSLFCFYSPSGVAFAEKRQEKRPYFLAPLDERGIWKKLLFKLRPAACVFVRHEIWPNCLELCSSTAPCYLVNASVTSDSLMNRTFLRWMLGYFKQVFAISSGDQKKLSTLSPDQPPITLAADSKYDRCLALAKAADTTKMTELLGPLLDLGKRYLVVGSSWPADAELVLSAFADLPEELSRDWQVLIAPHDCSATMISEHQILARHYGLSSHGLSAREAAGDPPQVVLVDQIGILAELYVLAEIAWIGGALHHKIHNILEAAAQGCWLCSGPRTQGQREAQDFFEQGLLFACDSSDELGRFWQERHLSGKSKNSILLEKMEQLAGGSTKVSRQLIKDLNVK